MKKKIYRVAGLGQCSLDYLTSIESYPKEDTKAEVSSFSSHGGGPVATALVALSRLGVKTYFSGVISDDGAGKEIRAGLKSEGVDTRALKVRPGGQSQKAFIVAAKNSATRNIFWQRPTVAPLGRKEVSPVLIKGKDFLLLDGLMPEASIAAATLAKEAGVPVMLDAGSLRPGIDELIQLSDVVVGSESFARAYGGGPVKALSALSNAGVKFATITLGAKGSVTRIETDAGPKRFKTPAFKVDAVDTTGAGDVFHGAYLYGLLHGWEAERTVIFASATAAMKCRKLGGRDGIPGLRTVQRFLRQQK